MSCWTWRYVQIANGRTMPCRATACRLAAVILAALLAGCDRHAEYRIAGRLTGLESGAVVVIRGQAVGVLARVEYRAETTVVRMSMLNPARAIRVGDAVRTRRVGLDHQIVLEIVPSLAAAGVLPRGAWLRLAAPQKDGMDASPVSAPTGEPRGWPLPHPYQLLPPGPPRLSRHAAHPSV